MSEPRAMMHRLSTSTYGPWRPIPNVAAGRVDHSDRLTLRVLSTPTDGLDRYPIIGHPQIQCNVHARLQVAELDLFLINEDPRILCHGELDAEAAEPDFDDRLFRVDGPDDVEVNLFAGGHDFRNSGSARIQLGRNPHAGFQIAELLFLAIDDNLCVRGNGQTIERNHL